ncbi:LOW QUALITY PROTEIN: RBBP8 N-terminal-like protein [Lontra canadensis]|uniref:LOW QUALITY PROTEIN: RBBP8 N-terminal-like protein n=1 Tax=Lontra canadensis TaxID=76717 RepID=UPI0013F2C764|nr:LOW QUALITY PROTEIN: RBBP8 N-terminal-like protein [Lontra canadensis]
MESFTESLNRLKEAHENEVRGLQNKLLELDSERCRDAQRVEELCAKNHQLREQQKALKENVRVLENRLRAGLCDRCMVTQELARKKQQEFETSLLQSLQHVFILTNELNRLQAENETLKEEVKRLQGPRLKSQCREGASDPPSPLLLPSPGAWKAIKEKTLGGHEEAQDDHPGASPQRQGALRDKRPESWTLQDRGALGVGGAAPPTHLRASQSGLPTTSPPTEKSTGYRTSPVAKIPPSANLPETRAPDMSPQRISNQLHGTIAVVRPGSQACSTDQGSTNGTPPLPLTRSSPPSPPYEHSLPLDSFLPASRAPVIAYESLKRCLQADHLFLLNHHLSLHLQSPPCSPQAPPTAPRGPRPQGLKAGEAEAWEESAGLLGLPGALVDVRDPRLEGALHLLLSQQLWAQGQRGSARLRGPPTPGGTPPSPPVSSDSEGPQGEAAGAAPSGGGQAQPTGPGSPRGQEATATRDHVPDKPLDLSERRRGRDAPKPPDRQGSPSPPSAHTPSPEPSRGAEPPAQSGPWELSNGTKGARAPESEEPPTPADPSQSLTGHHQNTPSPSGTGVELKGRPKPPPHPHGPDADGPPGKELSKARVQGLESDDLDVSESSDNEVGLSSEVGAKPSTPGEGPRCSYTKERGQSLPQKRKRASGPWCKASKKPPPGRRNPGEPLTAHEGSGSPRHPEDSSPSPSHSSWEET